MSIDQVVVVSVVDRDTVTYHFAPVMKASPATASCTGNETGHANAVTATIVTLSPMVFVSFPFHRFHSVPMAPPTAT